ncbi:MAG: hypothetical protein LKM45_06765 [Wolbachia endosymbiont of Alcedoecus sp.]|nr:hypothetical protein [Wolbachia endosymbiont of Alcedoecus sp.]
MNEHLFLQQVVSFQRVTLESRNFIRLVGIKVMLKCTVLWKTGSQCRSTGMTKKGDTGTTGKKGTGMTREGCLDNRRLIWKI